MRLALPLAALAVVLLVTACGSGTSSSLLPGADPQRGARLIERVGCGSCHAISGIQLAGGDVGPSLVHWRGQRFIAGKLANTPANLVRWIEHPQAVVPGNLMPDLGVTAGQARDIAAYLYAH